MLDPIEISQVTSIAKEVGGNDVNYIKLFGDGTHPEDSRLRYDTTTKHWYFEIMTDEGSWFTKFEVGGSVYVDIINLIACEKPHVLPEQLALYSRLVRCIENGEDTTQLRPFFVTEMGEEVSFVVADESDNVKYRKINGELELLPTRKWVEENKLIVFYISEFGDDSNDGKSIETAFATYEPVNEFVQENQSNTIPIEIRLNGTILGGVRVDFGEMKVPFVTITGHWISGKSSSSYARIENFQFRGLLENLNLIAVHADNFNFRDTSGFLNLVDCVAQTPDGQMVDSFGFIFRSVRSGVMRNCEVNNTKDAVVLLESTVDIYGLKSENIICALNVLRGSSLFMDNDFLGLNSNNIEEGSTVSIFNKHRYSLVGASETKGNIKVDGTEVSIGLDAVDNVQQIPLEEKGSPGGVATLDDVGKLLMAQVPDAVLGKLDYMGLWDASANVPMLQSGVGERGFFYVCNVEGSTTVDGIDYWRIGDTVIFSDRWQKIPKRDFVVSVNGQRDVVTLGKADVGLDRVDNTRDMEKPVSYSVQDGFNQLINEVNNKADIGHGIGGNVISLTSGDINKIIDSGRVYCIACVNTPIVENGYLDTVMYTKDYGKQTYRPATRDTIYTRSKVEGAWWPWSYDCMNADYIIDGAFNATSHSWHRRYKSGWIEQGGYESITGIQEKLLTLPIEMESNFYHVNLTIYSVNGGNGVDAVYFKNMTAKDMTIVSDYHTGSYKVGIFWEVKGNGKYMIK